MVDPFYFMPREGEDISLFAERIRHGTLPMGGVYDAVAACKGCSQDAYVESRNDVVLRSAFHRCAECGSNDFPIGVSALQSEDAWTFGEYSSGGRNDPLAMHWDGSSWTPTTTVIPIGAAAVFAAGAEIAPDDVCGVGAQTNGSSSPLAEHWNGTSWASVPIAAPGNFNELYAVAEASS